MASERGRTRKRKLLKLPGGSQLYVPVISKISFVDPVERYQETVYSVDNSVKADRDTHVDELYPSSGGVPDTSLGPLLAERIDVWKIKDARDRYQETHVTFDNRTGADASPPHFRTHERTHVYRYYQDPTIADDSGVWADFELIDIFRTIDARDRYQEKLHTLRNPMSDDATGQSSNDLEDVSDDNNGVDGPLRVDPFQNIVNYKGISGHRYRRFVMFYGVCCWSGPDGYNGFHSWLQPPGMMSCNKDLGCAISSLQAGVEWHIAAQSGNPYPYHLAEWRGLVAGPHDFGNHCFVAAYQAWSWVGWDENGTVDPNTLITDPDVFIDTGIPSF